MSDPSTAISINDINILFELASKNPSTPERLWLEDFKLRLAASVKPATLPPEVHKPDLT